MAPGDITAIDDFNTIAANDGEMGLYTTNNFGSSAAIIDYVEWGSTGHGRSSVAVAAGIWTTGDFVPTFGTGESLSYDGTGDTSADWFAGAPTIGSENAMPPPAGVAEVVINEILPNGTVELKNIGTASVDISAYWLCNFPDYDQLQNVNLVCGNLMIAPGEIIAVDGLNDIIINSTAGEMGLYIDNSFGNSASIVDYVDWGTVGGGRSGVAIAAGIWTTGDVVPSFATGESLAYDGSGDASTDWFANPSPNICMENGNPPVACTADGGVITTTDNTIICVDGNPDPINVTVGGNPSGTTGAWIITDDLGNILALPMAPPFDLDGAGIGVCQIWYVRHEADFMGNFVGNNLMNLIGCFDLSNPINVTREAADGGTEFRFYLCRWKC